MAATLPPIPNTEPPIEPTTKLISGPWYLWFAGLVARTQLGAQLLKIVTLTGQAASIGATTLNVTLAAGLYRVSWVLRVTTPATVSSSIAVTTSYTDEGLGVSQAGPAATGNTALTTQSGSFLAKSDAAAPVTFSTTYASVGGVAMVYKLDVTCELVT